MSDANTSDFMSALFTTATTSGVIGSNVFPPPNIFANTHKSRFSAYLKSRETAPLLFWGDSAEILNTLPSESVDCVMTSPPYWGLREYANGGIGGEPSLNEYIDALLIIFCEIKRVLKPTGSFWLNMGDTYKNKQLQGVPWRLALALIDRDGWVLRNDVIWNKVKGGMDNSTDKLGNVHEYLFHFVKDARGYFYDAAAIRNRPRLAKVINGSIVSATGVSGVRYKRQIEMTTALSDTEKENALSALNEMLQNVANGIISDFRMIIRGQQRTTHSDKEKVSGRAKELRDKGFYFLKYHPQGSKPSDVWEILPESTQNRRLHFASYPTDLCKIPILSTCPQSGIVLDPFAGTGSTLIAAQLLDRKSIGIDICEQYLDIALERLL